jgi:hypothetical protein
MVAIAGTGRQVAAEKSRRRDAAAAPAGVHSPGSPWTRDDDPGVGHDQVDAADRRPFIEVTEADWDRDLLVPYYREWPVYMWRGGRSRTIPVVRGEDSVLIVCGTFPGVLLPG